MARRKPQAKGAEAPDDEYRAAQLFRACATRLAVPATEDPVFAHRCREALGRGYQEAARADDWRARAEAMAAALEPVYGEMYAARLRRMPPRSR
jgi:hypothetical protein